MKTLTVASDRAVSRKTLAPRALSLTAAAGVMMWRSLRLLEAGVPTPSPDSDREPGPARSWRAQAVSASIAVVGFGSTPPSA